MCKARKGSRRGGEGGLVLITSKCYIISAIARAFPKKLVDIPKVNGL